MQNRVIRRKETPKPEVWQLFKRVGGTTRFFIIKMGK